MYKCKDCNKQFIGGQRRDKSQIITDYVEGKQTLLQLASKYKVSERTFYDRPETGLPNTNNAIEGLFSDIKSKLRAHRGISRDNRKKLLDEYIMRHY